MASRTTVGVWVSCAYDCARNWAAWAWLCPPVIEPGVTVRSAAAWYFLACALLPRNTAIAMTIEMTTIRTQFCAMTRK